MGSYHIAGGAKCLAGWATHHIAGWAMPVASCAIHPITFLSFIAGWAAPKAYTYTWPHGRATPIHSWVTLGWANHPLGWATPILGWATC